MLEVYKVLREISLVHGCTPVSCWKFSCIGVHWGIIVHLHSKRLSFGTLTHVYSNKLPLGRSVLAALVFLQAPAERFRLAPSCSRWYHTILAP